MDTRTLICRSAQDGTPAHKQGRGCDFCNSKGMAILPVRYAPISKLTNVPMHASTSAPSMPTPSGHPILENHHYALRLMRSGYLYLFDGSTQRIGAWQITSDAKFRLFAIDETDSNGVPDIKRKCGRPSESNEPFKCKEASHHVIASMIHWPAKSGTTLWLYYSELPMPAEALQTQLTKASWRHSHMQALTVGTDSDHAYPAARIPALLAEHNGTRQELLAPHPYRRDPVLGGDISHAFTQHMKQIQKRTGISGVMLALNDDIGFMEALNYDRHQPEQTFNATVGHAPEKKDEAQCTADELEVRRKLACYNMFNMLLEQKTAEVKAKAQSNDETFKAVEESMQDPRANSAGAPMAFLGLDRPEQSREKEAGRIKKAHANVIDNFIEYVDKDSFNRFKTLYESAVQRRNQQLVQMDKDYVAYVMHRSLLVVEAHSWMKNHIELAAAFIEITRRCLIGNVMTEHSEDLWHNHLLDLDSRSMLISSLGLQNPQFIDLLTDKLKSNDTGFANELFKASHLIKLGKAFNTFIAKCCKDLTDETILALLSRGLDKIENIKINPVKAINRTVKYSSRMLSNTRLALQDRWVFALARLENFQLRQRGMPFQRVVEVTLSASQYHAFIRELPNSFKQHYEPREMRAVASVEDAQGNTTTVRHQPVTEASAGGESEPTVKLYILAEDSDLKDLKAFKHGSGGDPITARIIDTNETIVIKNLPVSEKLAWKFGNITKQNIQQGGHGLIALFFASYSLYSALQKENRTLPDINLLVANLTGTASAALNLIDTGRTALRTAEDAGRLALLSESLIGVGLTRTTNALFITNAFFDALKATEAYLNGEPDRIVFWLGTTAAISALSTVIGMCTLTAGWSLGISVILALAYMAVVVMTMQELSLPQRLWIHRSIFGQHNLNYYNSEPFGGDTPTSASVEEWKDYQRRALNEEAQALAMLVSGITLEINKKRVTEGATSIVPKFDSTEKNSILTMKLSMPKNIDGDIFINIASANSNTPDIPSLQNNSRLSLQYIKESGKITPITLNKEIQESESEEKNNFVSKSIKIDITSNSKIEINLKISEKDKPFIIMASDKFKA